MEEDYKEPKFSSIADTLARMAEKKEVKKRPPNHELAATVDEVVKVIPLTARYGYGYWLKLIKRSGVSYTEMFGILKEISNMGNDKTGKPYNKAGTLVNKLNKRIKK